MLYFYIIKNKIENILIVCYNDVMKLSNEVKFVINKLEQAGYEAYLVGGAVRDFLLHHENNDIDITTNAKPEEIKNVFKDYHLIETGLKHGTVTLIYNHQPIEITTYRIDGDYIDNRHPNLVKFTNSLREDLLRRDFTINAMAYNKKLIDYFGGKEDLKNKLIRAVGDPNQRMKEDALRILRGLRFASILNFQIEEQTIIAMRENKQLLLNISNERIQNELNEILLGDNVKEVLLRFSDIFSVVIPELNKIIGFNQYNKYHIYDVYTHSVYALSSSTKDLIVRLTLLFHDIGKPSVFTMDESGNGHFYQHALESEKITRNILNRLKYDNDTKNQVITLIKYHDVVLNDDIKTVKRWLNRLGEDLFKKLIEVQIGDNFGQNPEYRDRQIRLNKIKELIDKVVAENNCFSLKQLAVNGFDMIKLGYIGSQIKEALNFALDSVINEKIENDKDKILSYIKVHFINNN